MGFARNWRNRKKELFGVPYLEQWQRIERRHARLIALDRQHPRVDSDELMDHVYACLQNCHMLRDWLLGCGVDRKTVEAAFSSHELKLCRDVANGTKHFEITRASATPSFLTVQEYVPAPVGATTGSSYRLTLCADGQYDLIDL